MHYKIYSSILPILPIAKRGAKIGDALCPYCCGVATASLVFPTTSQYNVNQYESFDGLMVINGTGWLFLIPSGLV